MKAFLLAAGNGTRLRPLTDNIPKCMVPIHGTPLLGIWMEWCRLSGIDEVLVNVHAHADAVIHYLAGNVGVNITISYEPELLGSAGTLYANREFVRGEDEFAVLYADVLTNCDFDSFLRFHRQHNSLATLGLYRVPNPSECGIAEIDSENRIVSFVEKPPSRKGNLAFSGLMIARPQVLELLSSSAPSDIGSDLLPLLVNRMHGFPIRDYLIDIGSLKKYAKAQEEWPGLHLTAPDLSATLRPMESALGAI